MNIVIRADGATVDQARALAAACRRAAAPGPRLGCDGPELFTLETGRLKPSQFAQVVGALVTSDGVPVAAIAENVQVALGELGEALMKDGGAAKDACIERAMDLLAGRVTP